MVALYATGKKGFHIEIPQEEEIFVEDISESPMVANTALLTPMEVSLPKEDE